MPDTTTTTPPPPAGTDPQAWASFLSFITGVTGGDTSAANKVADIADPYRSQRAQWQQPIVDLMKDPSSILQDPAFKASLNLGLEGVNRTAGAQGMSLSGNKLAALQQFGQTAGYNAIQTKFKNLEDLAGVTSGSPAAAAQAVQTGQTNTKNAIAAGLPLIGSMLKSLFPAGVPAAVTSLLKSMGLGQDASGNWTAVDSSGNPDPTGVNPPGGVDVNPNPNAVDPNMNPDPTGVNPPGGVDTTGDGTLPGQWDSLPIADDPFVDVPYG